MGRLYLRIWQLPFDRFTWDLSGYKQDGKHKLQVEITDELGLTARSKEAPSQPCHRPPGHQSVG